MEPENHTITPPSFDFDRERQKQTEKLELFSEVKEKRSVAKTSTDALKAKVHERDLTKANVKLLEEQTLAEQKKIDSLTQSRDLKTAEYVTRDHKSESGFFCRHYRGAKRIEMLELEIPWAEMKTEILRLDLDLAKKQAEKSDLDQLYSDSRVSLENLNQEIGELEKDASIKQDAVTKCENVLLLQFLEESKRVDEINTLNAEVTVLKKKLEEAGEKAAAADKLSNTLLEEINHEKEKKLEAERELEDVQEKAAKKLQEQFDRTLPYIKAAAAIRGRKLEWQKEEKDQNRHIIEMGNSVSHYGCVEVDMRLFFDPYLPTRRNDLVSFKKLYGVPPSFALKIKKSSYLCQILDWRGGMGDFHAGCVEANDPYNQHFCHFKTLLGTKSMKELLEYFDGSQEGKKQYEEMRKMYEADLKAHQAKLKRRKAQHRN